MAVFGILAAPFTGGASLVLTAGAGGVAGYNISISISTVNRQLILRSYKAVRMEDFEKEANSCRQSINSLSTEISQDAQAVASLEREKTELQSLVSKYQSEVTKRRSEQRIYQRNIEQADRVKTEIATLKSHAVSTKKNVVQALPELQQIKQTLEQCSTLVKERSLDVSTSSTVMERFTGSLPIVGTKIKNAREFNRQKLLLQQVSETLEKIHTEVPGLLPSSVNAKFLDVKPWNSDIISVVDVGMPIPDISFYTY